MADSLYTQKRQVQFRGPTTSEDYNARIEENYKDLVFLYNKSRVLDDQLNSGLGRLVKDQIALMDYIEALKLRIVALENDSSNYLFFTSPNQVTTTSFINTPYEIDPAYICTYFNKYNILTLPYLDVGSFSQLAYYTDDNRAVIPPGLETRVVQDTTSADGAYADVKTSEPERAILNEVGQIWERHILVDAPVSQGAACTLYIRVPSDLGRRAESNCLILDPFPALGVTVESIEYTSVSNPVLSDTDGYTPLNYRDLYSGDLNAVGWVPPGAWSDDTIISCGPKKFYFEPRRITAFRIKLRQKVYYKEYSQYLYSYGLTGLDLRYDKFNPSKYGKSIIKFEAPNGKTISSVTDVLPLLYNVPEYAIPEAFSYRIIWETALNSQVYTLTPVVNSQRVWIEVTLNMTSENISPALSGLTVVYS